MSIFSPRSIIKSIFWTITFCATSEGLWEVDLCASITPVLSYLHSVKFLLCLHGGIIRRIIVEINRLQDCSTKIFIHGQCHGSLHRSGQQNDVREKPLYGNQVGIHLHALCGYNRPCTDWQERTFALSPYVATNLFLMSSILLILWSSTNFRLELLLSLALRYIGFICNSDSINFILPLNILFWEGLNKFVMYFTVDCLFISYKPIICPEHTIIYWLQILFINIINWIIVRFDI